ncbi:MAG: exonuclease SbcCD subunit D [Atopobiaceae bacterium]|jgi:exonuclease SbcD
MIRFVHTADLHIGRRLSQMSLEEDQAYLLHELVELVQNVQADALIIAGDVFDSPTPSEAALRLWSDFLLDLAHFNICTLVVGGNHDSGARLAYGGLFAAEQGIHIAGELTEEIAHVRVGACTFWLLPFVRPADVRTWAARQEIDAGSVVDYTSAVALLCEYIRAQEAFQQGAQVLIAHQFVTAHGVSPLRSDSEQLSLGTLDNVDVSVFDGFDYVALGHVHRPQRIGRDTVRYAGSPLAYSTSEIGQHKSFAVVDIDEAPDAPDTALDTASSPHVSYELRPVVPLHAFRQERGSLQELLARARTEEAAHLDYIHAVVSDDSALDVVARLRHVWPNLAQVTFDNSITRAANVELGDKNIKEKNVQELFDEFFSAQAGRAMTEDEHALIGAAFEATLGEEATDETA